MPRYIEIQDQGLFKDTWDDMKVHIPRVCVECIENSWFIPYKAKLCATWLVDMKQFFGQISSSKVESTHAGFKRTLGTSQLIFLFTLA